MLVRNEADILGVNLAHHFAQGVDEVCCLATGERRGRYHTASTEVLAEAANVRSRRRMEGEDDPFKIVSGKARPPLPL